MTQFLLGLAAGLVVGLVMEWVIDWRAFLPNRSSSGASRTARKAASTNVADAPTDTPLASTAEHSAPKD